METPSPKVVITISTAGFLEHHHTQTSLCCWHFFIHRDLSSSFQTPDWIMGQTGTQSQDSPALWVPPSQLTGEPPLYHQDLFTPTSASLCSNCSHLRPVNTSGTVHPQGYKTTPQLKRHPLELLFTHSYF